MLDFYIKKKKLELIIILILLGFIVAFRMLGNGVDYSNYLRIFSNTNENIEPFYQLLRIINLRLFNGSLVPVFLVSTILSLYLKFRYILNHSDYYHLSIVFYILSFFLLHEYTQIRVSVSIGVLFWAIEDIKNKNKKKYFLKVVLALCFHYSSIIMIPLYFYCQNRFKFIYILYPWLLILLNITVLRNVNFTEFLINIISNISGTMGSLLKYKIGPTGTRLNVFNIYYFSLLLIITLIVFIKNKKFNEKNIVLIKITSFSLVIFLIFLNFNLPVLVFRLSEFVAPVTAVLFVNILSLVKQKYLVLFLLFIFFVLQFYLFSTRTIF